MLLAVPAGASQRTTTFDRDPHWAARNNTPSDKYPCYTVRQSFGWTSTSHVSPGGPPGELGGELVASLRPAAYAFTLRTRTFDGALDASGRFVVPDAPATRYSQASNPGEGSASLGFYGPGSNDFRGRNALGLRILGRRGPGGRRSYLVYLDVAGERGLLAPKQYQASDGSPVEFVPGRTYSWSLTYDPSGAGGSGAVMLTIDGIDAPPVVTTLTGSMRREGIRLDHFGLRSHVVAARRAVTWFVDDVTVLGRAWSFATDPGWHSLGSHARFVDCAVHNRQDFGWRSGSRLLGGRIWRTAPRGGGPAWYAARLARRGGRALSLRRPLRAAGELALRRASADAGFALGWFSSTAPLPRAEGLRPGFVGVRIGSISRVGFLLIPTVLPLRGDGVVGDQGPRIVPRSTGFEHFSIAYDPPTSAKRPGRLTATLGSRRASIDVPYAVVSHGTTLDRFGVLTTLVSGHSITFAIPRLTYTID